jgi:hypothetical protein
MRIRCFDDLKEGKEVSRTTTRVYLTLDKACSAERALRNPDRPPLHLVTLSPAQVARREPETESQAMEIALTCASRGGSRC